MPIGSRIRRRRHLDYASREDLVSTLEHSLEAAGNSSLMTTELRTTIAEHPAGNYRIMMNVAVELLTVAAERDLPRLDEKLYLELFAQPQKAKAGGKERGHLSADDNYGQHQKAAPRDPDRHDRAPREDQLAIEHASLDDPTHDDPQTLILARCLHRSARRLVADVHWYQRAIRALLKIPPPPDYPF